MDHKTSKYLVFYGVDQHIKFIHKIDQHRLLKRFDNNIIYYTQQFKIPHTHRIEIVEIVEFV